MNFLLHVAQFVLLVTLRLVTLLAETFNLLIDFDLKLCYFVSRRLVFILLFAVTFTQVFLNVLR